ncbi:hypothetical protein PG993_009053 [Apiospora rasikravindrae]|uniref:DUF605-domain-containing protein n=1 Tax=Apiospora rasikravindrae TaxID=990691 RepID=A0ABR1SIC4_9PEZI
MAANIPAPLKKAGITPFVVRATQLEKAKPVIAYWCEYWVVNQILAKQLHSTDDDCLQFTMALMDKLEQTKSEQAGNDAILDDVAGKAYVEQFAQETLERALRPLNANKVTQQTAVTFEAAATFFHLVNIWGPADAETEQKIKYAKWNAARILRAIKEGKDPNESNPKPQEEKAEEQLDPNDPEVQALGGLPRAATVEDAPEEADKNYLDPKAAAISPATVSAPTSPPHSAIPPEQVSPIAPPDQPAHDGYFPSAPSGPAADDDPPLQLPSAPGAPSSVGDPDLSIPSPPTVFPGSNGHHVPSGTISPPTLPDTPQSFYHQPQPPVHQPSAPAAAPGPGLPRLLKAMHPASRAHPRRAASITRLHISRHSLQDRQAYPLRRSSLKFPPHRSQHRATVAADDMSIVQAQKHAKWAISALNFEDVPTAVRELKAALNSLGAT